MHMSEPRPVLMFLDYAGWPQDVYMYRAHELTLARSRVCFPMVSDDPQALLYTAAAVCAVAYVVRWRTDPVSVRARGCFRKGYR